MSKYDALGAFLEGQSRSRIPMTFREIEQLLNMPLPASKKNRAWWSNNPTNNVMTSQWLKAGYRTEAVDIAAERLVFRREDAERGPGKDEGGPADHAQGTESPVDHLFGCMKETLSYRGDTDLTAPADPDWAMASDRG
ncbi:hypothetical protein [Jiella sp. M17.18]|uniref:DUF7662 domain-containing protein n=1 Tax=Jiella sp. M17.18 TaxID=3234247 RepID=UPI0034DFF5D9